MFGDVATAVLKGLPGQFGDLIGISVALFSGKACVGCTELGGTDLSLAGGDLATSAKDLELGAAVVCVAEDTAAPE